MTITEFFVWFVHEGGVAMKKNDPSVWGTMGCVVVLTLTALLGHTSKTLAQGDALSKTYTTISGITLHYPESWSVTENVEGNYTMLELDNTPSGVEKDFEAALAPGEVKIAFYMAPASQLFGNMGLPADASPEQVLNMVLDPSVFSFGPVYAATIGGAPAARADGSANDNRFDFIILSGQLSDGIAVIMQANTAWGEIGNFEPNIMAICESMTSSAGSAAGDSGPDVTQDNILSQSYNDPGGVITLSYPEGWIIDKYFGIIFIANSQAALEGEITTVETGEFRIDLKAGATYEIGLPESGTALEKTQAVLAEIEAEPDVSHVEGPEVLDGLSYDTAGVLVTQGNVDMIILIITADSQHAVWLTAAAPQGELDQYGETLLAIAQGIQFVGVAGSGAEEPTESTGVPENNAVQWQTETVSLSADNFYIIANGQTFTADVAGVEVGGDPGSATYTTLEVEWEEHGVPMRLYMYFESDGSIWQAYEIRTYDGSPGGEWIYYEGPSFTTPLGKAYQILSFAREYYGDGLYFENLSLQAFTSAEAGPGTTVEVTPEPTAETITSTIPTTISGPADCHNVAVSIGDYSSEYSASYGPINLLDGDPATGWSSEGGTEVEYVDIHLDGMQTVYGVLFNSYSPSSGYETDSIKDFSVETIMPSGETRVLFKGQAAFQPGYQSYTFNPAETDHLRFLFTSTYGGGYFEAADIMVCALKGTPPVAAVPGGEEMRQWASLATATSEYGSQNWSAAQATGAPDTASCGDYGTAWASSSETGIDELMVFFEIPVLPTQINIYQTYNPGAIASVTLLLAGTGDGIPVPNSADPGTACPGVFTISVPEGLVQQPVDGLAILVDQSNHTGWNEIDAVELVGYASGGVSVSPAPTTAQSLPAAVSCSIGSDRTVNMRSGPGTTFNEAGQIVAGVTVQGNGQAIGGDGYTWWRLTNGAWVRGDVVNAATNCSSLLPNVTADDPLPLTQRYTTPEGYSFDYPQDWMLMEETGGATIGNSWEAVDTQFGDVYEPGEFQISIRWMTAEELAPDTGLAANATPMQVLRAAIAVSSGIDLGEPYELAIGDEVVAAVYGKFLDVGVEIGVIIFDAGNGLYGSVLTGSDLNGLEQFEPTVRAIVESASYTP
jgi:hypothetical protein